MSLTDENRASGRPPEHFVVLELDGPLGHHEIWWTPDQAREYVASIPPDESGLNAGLLEYATEVERLREGQEGGA